MKKIIFAFIVLSSVACKKNCYTCTSTYYGSAPGTPTAPVVTEKCDMTKRGIDKYVKEHTVKNGESDIIHYEGDIETVCVIK